MLLEEVPRSLLASKYGSCPLKKRPVNLAREEPPQTPTPTVLYYDDIDDNDEPQNLSTKPEDLSKTGNYPSKPISPAVPETKLWENRELLRIRSPLVAAPPQFLCETELEPRDIKPSTWHTPCPQYPTYLPPMVYQREPMGYRSPLYADQYTAYGVRPTSCSPPLYYSPYSPSSPTSSRASSYPSPSPAPEDLTSPGSVSSDSGISATSTTSEKRKRDQSAPRYRCPDCDKSYSTYSGLSKHRQYHCAASENSLAKKSFSCKYCAKVYTSLGALKMHIRTHTLPCKCHLCGKAFSRPWLLQGHIRTHTGEKPFSCHHCRRAFADRSNLRAHLQTHSEVKKYSCSACSKTFSRMSLLSKHMEGGCGGAVTQHYHFRPDEVPAY